MKILGYYKTILLVIFICGINNVALSLEVNNYYGKYDIATKKPWRFATSLSGPHLEKWVVPIANKSYKIGVLVPHLQDSYWLAINYALIKEAERLGITLKIFNAGGYDKGGVQRQQLTEDTFKEKVDGILIAPIFYEKLDRFIEQIDKMGFPIVAMINDILSPHIKAGVTTSYYDIGYKIGEFIIDDAKGKDLRIAFFPGPKQAIWAADTYAGFFAAVKKNTLIKPIGKITIVALQYGKLTLSVQQQLVDKVLELKPNINYIVGNAIAAKAASIAVRGEYKKSQTEAKIIATYLLTDIYDLVKNKKIYGAAIDFNMEKARMALHLLIRLLNGEQVNKQDIHFPLRTAPLLEILTKDNTSKYKSEQLFAKKGFTATYDYVVEATNTKDAEKK